MLIAFGIYGREGYFIFTHTQPLSNLLNLLGLLFGLLTFANSQLLIVEP